MTERPSTVPADSYRLLGGGRLLAAACNQRLIEGLVPGSVEADPRLLMQRSLAYAEMAVVTLQLVRDHATSAHGRPLLRALLEQTARVLWAVRFGWERFFAWQAHQVRAEKARADKVLPSSQSSRYLVDDAEIADLIARAEPMPFDLVKVLADIDEAERSDSVFGEAVPWPESPEQWSRQTHFHVLTMDLNPAAHGDPRILATLERNEWNKDALTCMFAIVWLTRAVHLHCRWRQEPILWVYQWITRGEADPGESGALPGEAYGTLGLPPLPKRERKTA